MAVVDRTRASDSERERVAGRLRDAAAGRLTVDELDERTAPAYSAVTRGELAELLTTCPSPRAAARRASVRIAAAVAPGPLRVHGPLAGACEPPEAQADLMEYVAPPMHRFGYDLVERTPDRMVFERRTFPVWTLLPAIFLFPIGLLALLIRNDERVAIDLVERRGETLLIAQGVAPLPVRRAFAVCGLTIRQAGGNQAVKSSGALVKPAGQLGEVDEAPLDDLVRVRVGVVGDGGHEQVVELVLDQVLDLGAVAVDARGLEVAAGHPELLEEAAAGGVGDALAGPGVTAAGVGPEAAGVILGQRAALQEQLAGGVEGEDGERAMQRSLPVDGQLLALAQGGVGLVDEHHVLDHGERTYPLRILI